MSKLSDLIRSLSPSEPFHTYEFFPPRTSSGFTNLLDRIRRLCSSPYRAPLAISVTWGAGGSTAARSLELAGEIVKMGLGAGGAGGREVQVILHLTCTNMGKELVDEALKKCKQLGIRNILALRGDPPRSEEYSLTPKPDLNSFTPVENATNLAPGTNGGVLESRSGHMVNHEGTGGAGEEVKFEYAEDLVRYIRKEYGGWFCVGVAGYPTPHPDSTSSTADIHHLQQKVLAGADFILTQLFYDVPSFLSWVRSVRDAGVVGVPIIPGIMPIQNYASFKRLTNLCRCPVPREVLDELEPIKSDDALVKKYGIQLATRMISQILASSDRADVPGVHFCTLNLEKSVKNVMENLEWTTGGNGSHAAQDTKAGAAPAIAISGGMTPARNAVLQQDGASVPNQSFVDNVAPGASGPGGLLTSDSTSGSAKSTSTANAYTHNVTVNGSRALSFTDASGAMMTNGTMAAAADAQDSWDEYPNGRFTDVRSPAYGEIDGWGGGLKITPDQALREWGVPVDAESLSKLFTSYLLSNPKTPTTPFCDLPISPESETILDHLVQLNSPSAQKWTVGSQPAVDGAKSEDPIYGFGPKGGWIFQKAFVEYFVRDGGEVRKMMEKIKKEGDGLVGFYAANKAGDFLTNFDEDAVNAVTWAAFPGQEIVQSTIIEKESFLAWKEEAFEIWTEWSHLYPTRSTSRKLLADTADSAWLLSVIHHDYKDPEALWKFVLGDDYRKKGTESSAQDDRKPAGGQQSEKATSTPSAPAELSQTEFVDLIARSQASAAPGAPKVDLASLLGGGGSTTAATPGGFAIGKSKATQTFASLADGVAEIIDPAEAESPMMPGDFAAKPKAVGTNRTRLYCPREGCGSLILLEGAAEWVDVDDAERFLPREEGSPFEADHSSSPTSRSTWHVTGVPMCFENIGFTRTAAGKSSIDAATAKSGGADQGRAVKYVICAECDLGPLGWCYEGGSEGWLGVSRVRYGQ